MTTGDKKITWAHGLCQNQKSSLLNPSFTLRIEMNRIENIYAIYIRSGKFKMYSCHFCFFTRHLTIAYFPLQNIRFPA